MFDEWLVHDVLHEISEHLCEFDHAAFAIQRAWRARICDRAARVIQHACMFRDLPELVPPSLCVDHCNDTRDTVTNLRRSGNTERCSRTFLLTAQRLMCAAVTEPSVAEAPAGGAVKRQRQAFN